MNDPGLDKPINETSDRLEEEGKEEEDFEREDEQTFLNPSRWWFASTAFPLLAGTFGPMARYVVAEIYYHDSLAKSIAVPSTSVLWPCIGA